MLSAKPVLVQRKLLYTTLKTMESKQYVLMTKMYSEEGQSYEKFFGGTMIFERYLNNISKT